MTVKVFNPDSTVLQQVDGHWQKIAAFIVWKLVPKGQSVSITAEDLRLIEKEFGLEGPTLLTHGNFDSLEFKIVSREEAVRLAEYDRKMRGHA